jgi:hypothetical protein
MNTKPFPTPSRQFSLTNNIEIAKIDEIYQNNHNQFDMIPFAEELTLRRAAARFGINPGQYNIFQISPPTFNVTKASQFRLIDRNYNEFIQRRSTYFFINVQINKTKAKLALLLFETWKTNAGADRISTVYFPVIPDRFRYIMPSRGKRFR